MANSPTNIPADLPKDLTHELTVELSGNQDYAKAAGVMGLGFGYATAGGVYGMPAGAISNFGSAYSSAFGNLGGGGYLLPTAALYGTGTLEGTNRYSGPLLAGCAPYGLLPGYAQPWAGTYATYRIMSAHPTLVLAGAAVMGPILASSWSFEQNRKKAPKEAKGFIADLLMPLRPRLLLECLKALVFGWRGFEKIYSLKGGYLTLDRLKPLLPELTSILINDKGHLAGLAQAHVEASSDGIQIPAEKAFVYTYEGDGDNHYGRSRHENCRRQWSNWLMDEDNLGRLGSKVSSIIPQIGYPPGDGIDSQGNLQSNYQLAVQLATGLASGRPITMPNLASLTIDDLTRLPELAQASLWSIKTIDMGNPGPAQEALLKQLQYRDALLVRGWLRPERSLLESQRSGSRADSQVHADLGLTDCELVHADIAEAINRQIIDPLLAFNFGEAARGSVYIKPAAVTDDQQILDQRMLQAIAANPQLLPQLIAHLDMDAWLDRTGLPRNQLAGAWDGKMQARAPGAATASAPAASPAISQYPRTAIELFNPNHDERGRFTTADNNADGDTREKHFVPGHARDSQSSARAGNATFPPAVSAGRLEDERLAKAKEAIALAESIVGQYTEYKAAESAVEKWLEEHPSESATDLSPLERVPSDLTRRMNLAQAVLVAMKRTFEEKYANVDVGGVFHPWADMIDSTTHGKGLAAAINAAQEMQNTGGRIGLTSTGDEAVIFAPFLGELQGAMDAGGTILAEKIAAKTVGEMGAGEIAEGVEEIAGNAASKGVAEGATSDVAKTAEDVQQMPARGEAAQDGATKNDLIKANSEQQTTDAVNAANGKNAAGRFLNGVQDNYWKMSPNAISQQQAKRIVNDASFNFEIGRESRFNPVRNAVIIGKDALSENGWVNGIELAEELQHAIDGPQMVKGAVSAGISVERYHADLFQRIIDSYAKGGFQFLTKGDIVAITKAIPKLRGQ